MILHVAPTHVDIRPGQGSHKDVSSRRAFFSASGLGYTYINVSGDDPSQVLSALSGSRPTHVFIEYSYFPTIAKEIRRRFPDAFIAIRAHNIEPLQEWSLSRLDTPTDLLRTVYAFLRLLIADVQISRFADHIYVISPVDVQKYWRRLGVGPRTSWLPYLPPAERILQQGTMKRGTIACLPGGARSLRTIDLVNRFARFAQAAKSRGWLQKFVITGDISGWPVKLTPAVEQTGYVENLPMFYSTVAAVAVLSPIGYGFKTTIADAIWSGATVLVHPKIGTELPDELKPYCVMVDTLSPSELDRAHARLDEVTHLPFAPERLTARFNDEMNKFLKGNNQEPGRARIP
jgi:hypothetical protein